MKRAIYIAMIFMTSAISCSEEDMPETGCVTGIPLNGGDRVLVRCCTRAEFNAAANVAAGGVSYFWNYTDHQYEAGKTCKQCQDKWW